jgi:malate dehydrogenase (oxaloacetate-decarboxylating)(NADP+)
MLAPASPAPVSPVMMAPSDAALACWAAPASGTGAAPPAAEQPPAGPCAGVDPTRCLPVCIDVGTNNQRLLDDPAYKGLRQRRAGAAEFDELLAEFVGALKAWRPHVMLQWEDFGNHNAFK